MRIITSPYFKDFAYFVSSKRHLSLRILYIRYAVVISRISCLARSCYMRGKRTKPWCWKKTNKFVRKRTREQCRELRAYSLLQREKAVFATELMYVWSVRCQVSCLCWAHYCSIAAPSLSRQRSAGCPLSTRKVSLLYIVAFPSATVSSGDAGKSLTPISEADDHIFFISCRIADLYQSNCFHVCFHVFLLVSCFVTSL